MSTTTPHAAHAVVHAAHAVLAATKAARACDGSPEAAPAAESALTLLLSSALVCLRAADGDSEQAGAAWDAGVATLRALADAEAPHTAAIRRALQAVEDDDHADAVYEVERALGIVV